MASGLRRVPGGNDAKRREGGGHRGGWSDRRHGRRLAGGRGRRPGSTRDFLGRRPSPRMASGSRGEDPGLPAPSLRSLRLGDAAWLYTAHPGLAGGTRNSIAETSAIILLASTASGSFGLPDGLPLLPGLKLVLRRPPFGMAYSRDRGSLWADRYDEAADLLQRAALQTQRQNGRDLQLALDLFLGGGARRLHELFKRLRLNVFFNPRFPLRTARRRLSASESFRGPSRR